MDTAQIFTIIASIVGTIGPAMWLSSMEFLWIGALSLEQLKTEIQQIYGKFETHLSKLSEQLSNLEQQSLINAQRLGTLEAMSRDEYADLARYDERLKRLEQDVLSLSSKA